MDVVIVVDIEHYSDGTMIYVSVLSYHYDKAGEFVENTIESARSFEDGRGADRYIKRTASSLRKKGHAVKTEYFEHH